MRSYQWAGIGLMIIIAVAATACRANGIHLNVTFTQRTGLMPEDRVILNGQSAGRVSDIKEAVQGATVVDLQVDNGFADSLTDASKFYIIDDPARSGHKAIEIHVGQPAGNPLADGAIVVGATPADHLEYALQKKLAAGIDYLNKHLQALQDDIHKIPESKAYRRLEKDLKALAEELTRSEKAMRERIKREWLPKLERELDELKQHLRRFGREDDAQPLEEEVERIRRI